MFVAEIANKLSLCNNCLSERSYKYDHLVKLSEAEIFNINIKRTFIAPRCQKCMENIQTPSVTSRCINNPPLYCFVQPTPRLWQHAEMQSLMTNIIANSRPPIGPIRHSIHHQRPRLSFIAIPIEVSAFLGATLSRYTERYWFQLQTANRADAFVAFQQNSAYNQKDWVLPPKSDRVYVLPCFV